MSSSPSPRSSGTNGEVFHTGAGALLAGAGPGGSAWPVRTAGLRVGAAAPAPRGADDGGAAATLEAPPAAADPEARG